MVLTDSEQTFYCSTSNINLQLRSPTGKESLTDLRTFQPQVYILDSVVHCLKTFGHRCQLTSVFVWTLNHNWTQDNQHSLNTETITYT
jgi:hypothetical protein